MEVPSDNLI